VDNCVDKRLLTSREGSIGAGFNKLPNEQAKLKTFRINDLALPQFWAG
jgi:hypothetical protein